MITIKNNNIYKIIIILIFNLNLNIFSAEHKSNAIKHVTKLSKMHSQLKKIRQLWVKLEQMAAQSDNFKINSIPDDPFIIFVLLIQYNQTQNITLPVIEKALEKLNENIYNFQINFDTNLPDLNKEQTRDNLKISNQFNALEKNYKS